MVVPDMEFITIILYLSYFFVLGSVHPGFSFIHSLICFMFLNATRLIAVFNTAQSSASFTQQSLSFIYSVSRFKSLQCMGLKWIPNAFKPLTKILDTPFAYPTSAKLSKSVNCILIESTNSLIFIAPLHVSFRNRFKLNALFVLFELCAL